MIKKLISIQAQQILALLIAALVLFPAGGSYAADPLGNLPTQPAQSEISEESAVPPAAQEIQQETSTDFLGDEDNALQPPSDEESANTEAPEDPVPDESSDPSVGKTVVYMGNTKTVTIVSTATVTIPANGHSLTTIKEINSAYEWSHVAATATAAAYWEWKLKSKMGSEHNSETWDFSSTSASGGLSDKGKISKIWNLSWNVDDAGNATGPALSIINESRQQEMYADGRITLKTDWTQPGGDIDARTGYEEQWDYEPLTPNGWYSNDKTTWLGNGDVEKYHFFHQPPDFTGAAGTYTQSKTIEKTTRFDKFGQETSRTEKQFENHWSIGIAGTLPVHLSFDSQYTEYGPGPISDILYQKIQGWLLNPAAHELTFFSLEGTGTSYKESDAVLDADTRVLKSLTVKDEAGTILASWGPGDLWSAELQNWYDLAAPGEPLILSDAIA